MSDGQVDGEGGMGKQLIMRSQFSSCGLCASCAMKVGKVSENETFFWMRSGPGFMIDEQEDVFRLCVRWLVL